MKHGRQRWEPVSRSNQSTDCICCPSSAVATKTESPTTMGELCPRPGIADRQSTWFASLQVVGTSLLIAIPSCPRPRHALQSVEAKGHSELRISTPLSPTETDSTRFCRLQPVQKSCNASIANGNTVSRGAPATPETKLCVLQNLGNTRMRTSLVIDACKRINESE